MSATDVPPARTTLNLRIKPQDRHLIDKAARACGKNRTAFVLDAARAAAEAALLDQALLTVDPEIYDAFVSRLDQPASPNPRLHKTMRTPAPWDDA